MTSRSQAVLFSGSGTGGRWVDSVIRMRHRVLFALVAFALGFATFPLAMLATMRLGWWQIRADVPPPRWEQRLAVPAVHASVRRQAEPAANPVRPTDDVLRSGLAIYRNNCGGCHGGGRRRSAWGSNNFYPPAPQFGEAPPQLSEAEMFWVVKHGIRYSGMAGWDGLLADDQVWTIVTFLTRLDQLPTAIASDWRP